jgi:hypothetical protein
VFVLDAGDGNHIGIESGQSDFRIDHRRKDGGKDGESRDRRTTGNRELRSYRADAGRGYLRKNRRLGHDGGLAGPRNQSRAGRATSTELFGIISIPAARR